MGRELSTGASSRFLRQKSAAFRPSRNAGADSIARASECLSECPAARFECSTSVEMLVKRRAKTLALFRAPLGSKPAARSAGGFGTGLSNPPAGTTPGGPSMKSQKRVKRGVGSDAGPEPQPIAVGPIPWTERIERCRAHRAAAMEAIEEVVRLVEAAGRRRRGFVRADSAEAPGWTSEDRIWILSMGVGDITTGWWKAMGSVNGARAALDPLDSDGRVADPDPHGQSPPEAQALQRELTLLAETLYLGVELAPTCGGSEVLSVPVDFAEAIRRVGGLRPDAADTCDPGSSGEALRLIQPHSFLDYVDRVIRREYPNPVPRKKICGEVRAISGSRFTHSEDDNLLAMLAPSRRPPTWIHTSGSELRYLPERDGRKAHERVE